MNDKNNRLKQHSKLASPTSKQKAEKDTSYVTLPTTKAAKTDPEAVWEKPSWNPDQGDDGQEEWRIVRDAMIEP
jgi:hypothetical protein